MSPRTGVAIAVFLAAGVLLWIRSRPSPAAAAAHVEVAPEEETSPPSPPAFPTAPSIAPAPPVPTPAPPPPLDRARRDAMRELIYKAFGQPAPVAPLPTKSTYVLPEHGPLWTADEGRAEPGIEPEYIRDSVRQQFFPVANKCYSDALAGNPKLGGQIDLWFVIVGDKSVGGIVESVDVLNKSTLRDPDVIECLRESFLGVTFPPPKGGGAVTVEYPIIFSNDDDAGG